MSQGQLVVYALITAGAAGFLAGHLITRWSFAIQRRALERENDDARALWTERNRIF